MTQQTLALIKPDAVKAKNVGNIIAMIEKAGFNIVAMKMVQLTLEQGQAFYAVHKERPFYGALTSFISSGPLVALALEKDDAVKAWRDLMGATNPAQAAEGTVRKLYATSIDHNASHGSDAPETAEVEIAFFFPELA